MNYLENFLAARSAFTFDEQIRYLGWALLLLWMLSITYMTREFWFPAAFGHSNPKRDKRKPSPAPLKSSTNRRLSITKLNISISQLSDSPSKK
ncbi:hypothetical protein Q1695_006340 [Nippostrongylus brasiliensis]|nr:hypothetical protein Q1695_006340 [Nippostrongylus brasiliensis]